MTTTNNLIYILFDLTYSGLGLGEICTQLDITPEEVYKLRNKPDYKQMEKVYNQDRYRQNRSYVRVQHDKSKNYCSFALERLRELCDSENDKVALDAAKEMLKYQKELNSVETEESLEELEQEFLMMKSGVEDNESEPESTDKEVKAGRKEGE